MSTVIDQFQPTDDDSVVEFTQTTRKTILNSLIANGIPNDPEVLKLVANTLDSMDRTALAKKKIKSDEGIADKTGMAHVTITHMLKNMRNEISQSTEPINRENEVLIPDNLPIPKIVPGELDTMDPHLNYDSVIRPTLTP